MINSEYWRQRGRAVQELLLAQGEKARPEVERAFHKAVNRLSRDMEVWYARVAKNTGVSLAEAKRMLNTREREEFRWTVEEYIKRGEESGLDGKWMKELENASARVHISRLDALRLQAQQLAEELYGNQVDVLDKTLRGIYEEGYYRTAFTVQQGAGVGVSLHRFNENQLKKVVNRPWTTDMHTFRDRCWTNKQALVGELHTQLIQSIIRGDGPQEAIKAITRKFGVAQNKAARLVLTESAHTAAQSQKDCFDRLGVEQYEIVGALDKSTCKLCGDLDGKVFRQADYEPGCTAPPFHPWCRCTTAPYFGDEEELGLVGKRAARNLEGRSVEVPGDMTFEEWKEKYLDNSTQSDKMDVKTADGRNSEVHKIGKIDRDIYKVVSPNITTDDVVITDNQINHVKERHPQDYERYSAYLPQIVSEPDYILASDKPHTAFILKTIKDQGDNFQVILRLKTPTDPENYLNSIITFLKVDEKRYQRYLRTKRILYKKE